MMNLGGLEYMYRVIVKLNFPDESP